MSGSAVRRVCDARVQDRLMLQEDADHFVEAAQRKNPLDPSVRLGALIEVAIAPGA